LDWKLEASKALEGMPAFFMAILVVSFANIVDSRRVIKDVVKLRWKKMYNLMKIFCSGRS
jgi:hypothetical protein